MVVGLAACSSDGFFGELPRQVALKNSISDSVCIRALELEMSHLIDINSTFVVDANTPRVLAPYAEKRIALDAIDGFTPGATVRFFIYRIQGGRARLVSQITVNSAQFRALQWRIEITPSLVATLEANPG